MLFRTLLTGRALAPAFFCAVVGSFVGCATSSAEARYARSSDDGDSYAPASDSEERSGGTGVFAGLFDGNRKEMAMAPPAPPPSMPNGTPTTTPPEPAPTSEPKPIEASKRLVIYTGSLALMVADADTALDGFITKVNGLGGYLQNRTSTTVTVRVPAEQFFSVLDGLRKSGTVTQEQINANDVTKRVFDIELRLQTADESRKRLIDILKSATKIEDILRIESEIRRLTDEIEAMKGELRNLGDQIAFSTLTVSFFANAPAPRAYPARTRSRFEWINQIGVEQVLNGF